MDSPITRAEHNEFVKRVEDEDRRQNHRITELEKTLEQNNKLLVSVERLALNMENMQKELSNQGKRVEELESRDGKKWRDTTGYVLTAVIGIVIGLVFKQIGM